jgi:uroporphyrinogen-III synthase
MQIPLLKGEGAAKRRVRGKEMRPKFKSKYLADRARQLRKDHTRAEKVVWQMLKNRKMFGLKFRRQVPIDCYIADFFCPEIHLILEMDGGVHGEPEHVKRDAERDRRLMELGYEVCHIPNHEVLSDPDWFPEMIRSLYPSPAASRHPLPSGEGFAPNAFHFGQFWS